MPKGMPASYDQKVDQKKYSENWNSIFNDNKKWTEEEQNIIDKYGKISYDREGKPHPPKKNNPIFPELTENDLSPKTIMTNDGGVMTRTPIIGDRKIQSNKEYREEKRS